MVKRLFCFILLCLFIFLFSSPAFALNTVGFVQQDMSLVGASFYSTQYTTGLAVMYPSSSDDSISKFFNASSVDITDGYFYIIWRAPPVYEYSISCSFNFAGDLDIQSSDIMLGAYRESAGFYAFPVSYDVDVISMPGVYQGLTSYTVNFSVDTTSLDYIYDYCCLCVHTGSNAYFSPGVSFASSGSSLSLTPGSSTSSVSLSGRVGFRSISSNYTYNYSSLPSNFGNALLKVVPLSDSSGYNGQSGVFFRTVSVLADVFGGASSSSVDADAVIRTASSGTVSNPTYSGSSSISSISASSNSFVLLSDTGSFYYGDDDGLVDTVKNIDGTLTDMAGNLQTITDDFTAKKETAEDIGGVVSDTDISDNDATLSTGMDSLDQGIDSLNISDVSAPALSFSSFMTANAVALLNFGNGVLYWALFALVKLRNECSYGTIKCYIAHRGTAFGTGKTLSATREIVKAYKRYNGKPVWCPRRQRLVTQRIHVLSNVEFKAIPYEYLKSLSQFVGETDTMQDYDDKHNCLTVTYLFIDEASSQLNSRSFKSNFDAPFISRLLTSRHVRANLILTSQRSGMVDKLMRDCCNWYISCQKLWRFEILRWYDAYSIECAQEPDTVAPVRRTGYFIKDNLFSAYDTFASVKALEKSCKEGDMLSAEEILALRVGDSLQQAASKRQAKKARKGRRR